MPVQETNNYSNAGFEDDYDDYDIQDNYDQEDG